LRSSAFDADIVDAIDDGIIIVSASGNSATKIDNFSSNLSADYNNYIVSDGFLYYYNRGPLFATPGSIQVGAIAATVSEEKATYSNCGPRIDLYAPGSLIMTTINSGGFVSDARDPIDRWTKVNGTSFSSPQVAGALACLAEQWPTMTQAQALRYITENATVDQIADTEGGPGDNLSLQGSENRYLYYVKERQEQGQITPRSNQGFRPTSGLAWPRPRIYRYGR
jgi:subtilisin family serine protease